MRKKSCIIAVLLVLPIVVCALPFVIREHPKCSVEFLVLDEDKMAGGWRNDLGFLPPALDALGAQEALLMTMKSDDNGAISHAVYRYRNRWLAAFHFWLDGRGFFPSVSMHWSELEQADRLSLHADQQWIQCGISDDPILGDMCVAVLRYNSYISDFSALTSGEGAISLEEFEEIVLKIDERFRLCGE